MCSQHHRRAVIVLKYDLSNLRFSVWIGNAPNRSIEARDDIISPDTPKTTLFQRKPNFTHSCSLQTTLKIIFFYLLQFEKKGSIIRFIV